MKNEQTSRQDLENILIEKAMKDLHFRQQLLGKPRETIEEALGMNFPPSMNVMVLEEKTDTFYLVLPASPPPFPSDELSENELRMVAGGGAEHTYGSDCYTEEPLC